MASVAMTETRRYAATTDAKWDGSASRFSDEQYQRSCLIDRGGDAPVKERCSLPVLEPDGTINTNALSAAAGRLGSLTGVTDAQVSRAKSKLRSLYKTAGLDAPDSVAMSEELPRHDLLVALGELETVDVDSVEILSAGGPYFGTGSPPEGDTFDVAFLQTLADANNALARQVLPPIKIGHSRAQKLLRNSGLSATTPGDDEQPAAGWLENFRVSGDKLLADAKSVPRKIADLMRSHAFRSRSVEMAKVTEQTADGAGREFPSVVTALALLGAKAPAVRTLDDILAWYGERGSATSLILADEDADPEEIERDYAVGDVIWDPEQGANDVMADLCAALNGPGPSDGPPRFWVRDVAMTGNRALVQSGYGDDADAWVVPYAMGDDGEPVPAPSSDWTLASQKWLQASETAAAEAMGDRARAAVAISTEGADTSVMADENTATLTDENVVTFASAFGIEETDAAKRRDAVLAKFKEFAGEAPAPPTPPDTGDPAPPAPPTPTPPAPEGEDDPRIAALEARAALGERAFEERRVEKRDASIRVAIEQGRIDPAAKDQWTRYFDENEELAMTALLSIPVQPRRIFGSDDPGHVEYAEQVGKGYDAAYGQLAGALGITPHTLAQPGGQS